MGVRISYGWGLVLLCLGLSNSYVCGLVFLRLGVIFLHLGVSNSYLWGLVYYVCGLVIFTFGGYRFLRLEVSFLTFGG